jgi:hypothetical protein
MKCPRVSEKLLPCINYSIKTLSCEESIFLWNRLEFESLVYVHFYDCSICQVERLWEKKSKMYFRNVFPILTLTLTNKKLFLVFNVEAFVGVEYRVNFLIFVILLFEREWLWLWVVGKRGSNLHHKLIDILFENLSIFYVAKHIV